MTEVERMTRQEAIAKGLKRYWPTEPCKHGHDAPRRVSPGSCLECDRLYKEANKDRTAAYGKAWQEANREHVAALNRRWYQENRERKLQAGREWAANNAERKAEANRRWAELNADRKHEARKKRLAQCPETITLQNHRRRARKKEAGGSFTKSDVQEILANQRKRCAVCRQQLARYEIDHIVPLFLGGSNGRENIQLLCRPCNRAKGRRDPIEFMQSRGRLL